MDISFSEDEDIVCISENDACGVDAIQSLLGCSVGKGNLLFHMTGKQAFSFYDRASGRSLRLVLKKGPGKMPKEKIPGFCMTHHPSEMFEVKPATLPLPERARFFDTYVCECCGERVASGWIRLQGGKKLCVDCFKKYDRFNV